MTHENKFDKVTETTIQPILINLFASLLLYGIFGFLSSVFPYYSKWHLYIAVPLSSLGIISSLWLNQYPNFWAKFLKFLALSGLLILSAVRFFEILFPKLSLILGTLIILSVLAANLWA